MKYNPLKMLFVAGKFKESHVFSICVASMVVIFIVDVLTGSTVRLHNLYVAPLALVVIHCKDSWRIRVAFLGGLLMQALTLWTDNIPNISRITEIIISTGLSSLTIAMAHAVRENHGEIAGLVATDSLTGLLNHRSFDEILHKAYAHQMRFGGESSVAVFQLMQVKDVHTKSGFTSRDKIIKVIATTLRTHFREIDVVARLKDYTFVVLMFNTNAEKGQLTCENMIIRIVEALSNAGFNLSIQFECENISTTLRSVDHIEQLSKAMHNS